MACCLLHNLLRTLSAASYTPVGHTDETLENGKIVKGQWRNEEESPFVQLLQPTRWRHATLEAEDIRDTFCDYLFWTWTATMAMEEYQSTLVNIITLI